MVACWFGVCSLLVSMVDSEAVDVDDAAVSGRFAIVNVEVVDVLSVEIADVPFGHGVVADVPFGRGVDIVVVVRWLLARHSTKALSWRLLAHSTPSS